MDLSKLGTYWHCDKFIHHSYAPFYQWLFSDMKIRNLLEIGIGYKDLMEPFAPGYIEGASLYLWADLFPDAQIYACDIREDILINEGRIHSFLCDQSDPDQLLSMAHAIGEELDIVIDDGSHQTDHQIISAKWLLPYLAKGGCYCIEDVLDPMRILQEFPLAELHSFGKYGDDNIVLIRGGAPSTS